MAKCLVNIQWALSHVNHIITHGFLLKQPTFFFGFLNQGSQKEQLMVMKKKEYQNYHFVPMLLISLPAPPPPPPLWLNLGHASSTAGL